MVSTFVKHEITKGINLYYLPLTKFKTQTVSINIHTQLSKETATKNALLPNVLKRGCKKFPNAQTISEYLESLYGSVFDCGIHKKGENQIIYFHFECIDDQYIPDNTNILEKILWFSKQLLLEPIVEKSGFKEDFVVQEKEKLRELIESMINNKMTYAVERCYQEMCKNEPFGIYEYGQIEKLKQIDRVELYQHYQKLIKSSPIDIFVAGGDKEKDVVEVVKQIFTVPLSEPIAYPTIQRVAQVSEVKKVEEALDVAQGKLSMGFRTSIAPTDKEYEALMVYNSILGGGPHSKLFNNVREKLSLAYYVFSRLEKFKSLMIISSGIEIDKFDDASKEIMAQMEAIKIGEISQNEFDSAIHYMVNGIRSLQDNAFHMIEYYLGQLISGTDVGLETLIERIKAVTKKDVIEVASNIQLDIIYFLKNKK